MLLYCRHESRALIRCLLLTARYNEHAIFSCFAAMRDTLRCRYWRFITRYAADIGVATLR